MEGGNTVKLNLGEGATWAGAGLLGMAVSLRDLADDEKGAWDKVNTTAAKQKARHKQAVVILQIVGRLHRLMRP